MQTTSQLLMIRPVRFGFNSETAVNNAFQVQTNDDTAQQQALKEFDNFVQLLRQHQVDVLVIEDTAIPFTPDSIFPNNWISFHNDHTICLYPMFAPNRRQERKTPALNLIKQTFHTQHIIDFTHYENDNLFLEGTGSMVLDRENKIAYACISPRTSLELLQAFCNKTGYKAVWFDAVDGKAQAIYHTNVMMCVAEKYVVICLESVTTGVQKQMLVDSIKNSGKDIIEISLLQVNHFAGNMLQVHNKLGEQFIIMSTQALQSLQVTQVQQLESYNRILHSPLTTIETNGGGSARCMMAEVFV